MMTRPARLPGSLLPSTPPLPRLRRPRLGLAVAGLSFALALGCAPAPPELVEIEGPTMGTRFAVKLVAPNDRFDRAALTRQIEDLLRSINAGMSTYLPDSELSRLNDFPAGEPYTVSKELMSVLSRSEDLVESTDGAFDPTVGPVVDLWGFGPRTIQRRPTEESVQQALSQVGWREHLRLDLSASTVLKTSADVRIDLSAIAKGYAVDEILALVREVGVEHALVEVGGELRAVGFRDPARAGSWRVGIESPRPSQAGVRAHRIIPLPDRAIATSGDYRNFYEVDGVRYSHTIDPQSGRPVTHRGASVTVIAKDCATADALATALLVMGPDAGFGWAERNGVAALFLSYAPPTELDPEPLTERRTSSMNAYLVDHTPNP